MLDKKTVAKIKKAVRNMKTENDTFYIKGEKFFCRWNGRGFDWTVNERTYMVTVKEVIQWIADGSEITSYCFDYDN